MPEVVFLAGIGLDDDHVRVRVASGPCSCGNVDLGAVYVDAVAALAGAGTFSLVHLTVMTGSLRLAK